MADIYSFLGEEDEDDYEGVLLNFLDEKDCPHTSRIIFELSSCVAYECPACGNVRREMHGS